MKGRRSKVIQTVVAVLVVLAALLFYLQGGQLLSQFTDFMDVSTMRLMMLGLVGVVTLQAVGLYVLARRTTAEATTVCAEVYGGKDRFPNKVFETEQRGRGRPRKPCSLALTGLLQCPLEPNLEIEMDPAFISRISAAVADFQHEKLGTIEHKQGKLVDLEAEPVGKEAVGEKPVGQSRDILKEVAQQTESKREEGIGELVVGMAEVLSRKAEKEKEDKKEEKREKTGK